VDGSASSRPAPLPPTTGSSRLGDRDRTRQIESLPPTRTPRHPRRGKRALFRSDLQATCRLESERGRDEANALDPDADPARRRRSHGRPERFSPACRTRARRRLLEADLQRGRQRWRPAARHPRPLDRLRSRKAAERPQPSRPRAPHGEAQEALPRDPSRAGQRQALRTLGRGAARARPLRTQRLERDPAPLRGPAPLPARPGG
jgi:hypothetical protein